MTKWGLSLAIVVLAACHHTGIQAPNCDSPTLASLDDPNTVAVIVDPGPPAAVAANQPYTNGLFASITLCVPGTATCQTIDHLLVDTGSVGVRVLESLLTVPLPAATTDAGLPLAECTQFVDSATWGPLKMADVQVGQEFASGISIQAIGDELTFKNIPADCTGTPNNNVMDLGANGILGVGLHQQDCGRSCVASTTSGLYYACNSSATCTPTTVPLAKQVTNPISAFPIDNNGVIIQLPCVPPGGSSSVHGVMLFGIGTQPNNGLGDATPLPSTPSGFITTAFPEGGAAHVSFIDSGSNATFFLNESTSGIKQCPKSSMNRFYCPSSTTNLTARIIGTNKESAGVQFSVANASTLPAASNAFSDLAGTFPGYFDWGLPFFFGRSMYTAIEDQPTPGGVGPYFAF